MNDAVDIGQIEGGLVQGLGWMTMEERRLQRQRQAAEQRAEHLQGARHPQRAEGASRSKRYRPTATPLAIRRSKAVGEPLLMYGIGVYFATSRTRSASRPDARMVFDAPYTPEKVLMSLYA
ncbi:MAG: molybdopterin cofactor-binding domain-containing protein [Flavobacteriales bacterium]